MHVVCLYSLLSFFHSLGHIKLLQNWKDAVRKSFQFPPPPHAGPVVTVSSSQPHGAVSGARKLKLGELPPKSSRNSANNNNTDNINLFDGGNTSASEADHGCSSAATSSRRLTRSALNKTLLERDSESSAVQQDKESPSPAKNYPPSSSSTSTTATNAAAHYAPSRVSVFDIRGLSRLKATFSALDNSVKDIVMGREKGKNKDGINILAPDAVSCYCACCLSPNKMHHIPI